MTVSLSEQKPTESDALTGRPQSGLAELAAEVMDGAAVQLGSGRGLLKGGGVLSGRTVWKWRAGTSTLNRPN